MTTDDQTRKPARAKVLKGSKQPPVHVQGKPQEPGVKRAGKGWTSHSGGGKGTPAARPGGRGRIYPIQVVTTRWKDSRTGKFVKSPNDGTPLRLKVARPRAGAKDGMVITRTFKRDEATGMRVPVRYKVQYLEAREAHRRGELGTAELRALEDNLADGLMSEEGQAIMRQVEAAQHSQEMHAAHRSDKAKRAAVTRKAKTATRKHRSAAAIQSDHLKIQADLQAARLALKTARTSKSVEAKRRRIHTLTTKAAKVRKEAKAAGVSL